MAPVVEITQKGNGLMSELSKLLESREVQQVFEKFRHLAEKKQVQGDAAEWKGMQAKPNEKDSTARITSMELAPLFGCPHSKIFQRIAKFLGTYAGEEEKQEFELTAFRNNQEREFPMWNLTERACEIYIKQVCMGKERYVTISDGLQKLRALMNERFYKEPERRRYDPTGFLLEGKASAEYADLKQVFDRFITGPAVEGREIIELTKKYEKFFAVLQETNVTAQEDNRIFDAVAGIAIEAELQGFIYGFKMFGELMNYQVAG